MRRRTEAEQEEEYRQATQWAVKRRWFLSAVYLVLLGGVIEQILVKRSQWHLLFAYPPAPGVSVWEDIITCLLLSTALVELWLRVYRYQREQNQATPTDRV